MGQVTSAAGLQVRNFVESEVYLGLVAFNYLYYSKNICITDNSYTVVIKMHIIMWSEKYLSFATFIYVIIIINNIIEISHSMKCDVGTEYFEDRNEGPMCKECNVGDYNDVPLSDNASCKNCPNDKPYTHGMPGAKSLGTCTASTEIKCEDGYALFGGGGEGEGN